jgi:ABC-type multidrug transport system fused ATPase/permease subunit
VALSFLIPVLMPYMLRNLNDLSEPDWWGYLYVVAIVVGQIFGAFFYYHATFTGWTLAAKIRAIMIMMTYKKALKVQNAATRDSGRVVNMVSSDAQCVLYICVNLLFDTDSSSPTIDRILSDTFDKFLSGLVAPIQLIVATGLLIKELYAYALIPLGVFVLSFPASGYIGAQLGTLRFKQQIASDNRLKLIRELISAIRIVKYYAWEIPFEANIDKYREVELERIRATNQARFNVIGIVAAVAPIGIGSLTSLSVQNSATDLC